MKKIEELTKENCQEFLDEIFAKSVIFNKIIFDCESIDGCGIEYKTKDHIGIVPFSNPDLILWLYKNDYDIIMPLTQLRIEYTDMDENNSVLFEYAMSINNLLVKSPYGAIIEKINGMSKIRALQNDLVRKLI